VKVSTSSLGGAGCAVKIENGSIDRNAPQKSSRTIIRPDMAASVVQDIEWLTERSRLFREGPEGPSGMKPVIRNPVE
jgi:hypothetical protein